MRPVRLALNVCIERVGTKFLGVLERYGESSKKDPCLVTTERMGLAEAVLRQFLKLYDRPISIG